MAGLIGQVRSGRFAGQVVTQGECLSFGITWYDFTSWLCSGTLIRLVEAVRNGKWFGKEKMAANA